MESYPIHEVERLTGIKAHTLRIWEKRYKTLLPHRTPSKIRYYDDSQVRILLNIASLLKNGFKISHLMTLTDDDLNQLILELKKATNTENAYNIYVNELIKAILKFDEAQFEDIFTSVIIRYGMQEAVIRVYYPFLDGIGLLWSTNSLLPAHEHFASQIIKRKFYAAIDRIPLNYEKTKKFLLFLPPNEFHELGLLFSHYLVRSEGYKSIYLGQDLPIKNLQNTIQHTQPDFLLTFLVPMEDSNSILNNLYKIATDNSGLILYICTKLEPLIPAAINNIILVHSPNQLLAYL